MKKSLPIIVMQVLTEYPVTRDDIGILSEQVAVEQGLTGSKASEFAKLVLKVDRTSRKLQREYPGLRGNNWEARQGLCKKIKKEIIIPFDFQTEAERVGFIVTKLRAEKEQTIFSKLINLIW